MTTHLLRIFPIVSITISVAASTILFVNVAQAQTAPPPSLGDETKGAPAVEESDVDVPSSNTVALVDKDEKAEEDSSSFLGTTTVVESRRESGQIYLIELKHSNGPTQYIEETDSDGNIEFKSNDIEDTPNLPKWKLGSW